MYSLKKKTLFSAIRYRNIQNEKKIMFNIIDQTRWSTNATFHQIVTFYNSVFINLKEKEIHLAVIQIKYGDNEKNLAHSKRFP